MQAEPAAAAVSPRPSTRRVDPPPGRGADPASETPDSASPAPPQLAPQITRVANSSINFQYLSFWCFSIVKRWIQDFQCVIGLSCFMYDHCYVVLDGIATAAEDEHARCAVVELHRL
ncbi:unnamed protein product [Urochloa humidicola]